MYKIQKLDTTKQPQTSNQQVANQMWYDHIIQYYSAIKKKKNKTRSTDLCYNVNELWKRYAKWKKPDTKDHILHDSIYMKGLE